MILSSSMPAVRSS